jgi:transposase
MRGIPEATPIVLTADERAELEDLARSTKTEYRLRQRAQIVLLAAEGVASRAIGRKVGCTTGTASKWRVRYARDRLAGLDETGDRGAEPKYTAETDKRILAVLDRPVPAGHGRWTGPLIAAELGDVDVQYIWRFLRSLKIDLAARKSWCQSNDPQFAAKAAEIVGLYLDPPDGALVLAVDEKPSIQALERAQGYLKLPKRPGADRLLARLQAARHHNAVRRSRHRHRRGSHQALWPPSTRRVPRFYEPHRSRASQAANSCHPRQPQHPQAEDGPLARPSSQRALPFHADARVLAQSDRDLVLGPE